MRALFLGFALAFAPVVAAAAGQYPTQSISVVTNDWDAPPQTISTGCTTPNFLNCPANSTAGIQLVATSAVTIQVAGSPGGTLQLEGSFDGVNWTTLNVAPFQSATYQANITAVGTYQIAPVAFHYLQLRGLSGFSGTTTVAFHTTTVATTASSNSGNTVNATIANPVDGSGNVKVDCAVGCTSAGGAPLTGGSIGVTAGPNQGVAVHAVNASGTIDRLREDGNNVDAEPLITAGALYVKAYGYAYNGATNDRLRSTTGYGGTGALAVGSCDAAAGFCTNVRPYGNSDANAGTQNAQAVGSFLQGLNGGGTWDRLRAAGLAGQAGIAAPTLGSLNVNAFNYCTYNTTAITATSGNVYPFQCDANGNVKVAQQGSVTAQLAAGSAQIGYLSAWSQTQFTSTSANVIKGSAGVVSGIAYLSNVAMATSQQITCYDNASALSGTIVLGPWTLASGFMPSFPTGGITFTNGLTCGVTAGAALTSPVAVYTH